MIKKIQNYKGGGGDGGAKAAKAPKAPKAPKVKEVKAPKPVKAEPAAAEPKQKKGSKKKNKAAPTETTPKGTAAADTVATPKGTAPDTSVTPKAKKGKGSKTVKGEGETPKANKGKAEGAEVPKPKKGKGSKKGTKAEGPEGDAAKVEEAKVEVAKQTTATTPTSPPDTSTPKSVTVAESQKTVQADAATVVTLEKALPGSGTGDSGEGKPLGTGTDASGEVKSEKPLTPVTEVKPDTPVAEEKPKKLTKAEKKEKKQAEALEKKEAKQEEAISKLLSEAVVLNEKYPGNNDSPNPPKSAKKKAESIKKKLEKLGVGENNISDRLKTHVEQSKIAKETGTETAESKGATGTEGKDAAGDSGGPGKGDTIVSTAAWTALAAQSPSRKSPSGPAGQQSASLSPADMEKMQKNAAAEGPGGKGSGTQLTPEAMKTMEGIQKQQGEQGVQGGLSKLPTESSTDPPGDMKQKESASGLDPAMEKTVNNKVEAVKQKRTQEEADKATAKKTKGKKPKLTAEEKKTKKLNKKADKIIDLGVEAHALKKEVDARGKDGPSIGQKAKMLSMGTKILYTLGTKDTMMLQKGEIPPSVAKAMEKTGLSLKDLGLDDKMGGPVKETSATTPKMTPSGDGLTVPKSEVSTRTQLGEDVKTAKTVKNLEGAEERKQKQESATEVPGKQEDSSKLKDPGKLDATPLKPLTYTQLAKQEQIRAQADKKIAELNLQAQSSKSDSEKAKIQKQVEKQSKIFNEATAKIDATASHTLQVSQGKLDVIQEQKTLLTLKGYKPSSSAMRELIAKEAKHTARLQKANLLKATSTEPITSTELKIVSKPLTPKKLKNLKIQSKQNAIELIKVSKSLKILGPYVEGEPKNKTKQREELEAKKANHEETIKTAKEKITESHDSTIAITAAKQVVIDKKTKLLHLKEPAPTLKRIAKELKYSGKTTKYKARINASESEKTKAVQAFEKTKNTSLLDASTVVGPQLTRKQQKKKLQYDEMDKLLSDRIIKRIDYQILTNPKMSEKEKQRKLALRNIHVGISESKALSIKATTNTIRDASAHKLSLLQEKKELLNMKNTNSKTGVKKERGVIGRFITGRSRLDKKESKHKSRIVKAQTVDERHIDTTPKKEAPTTALTSSLRYPLTKLQIESAQIKQKNNEIKLMKVNQALAALPPHIEGEPKTKERIDLEAKKAKAEKNITDIQTKLADSITLSESAENIRKNTTKILNVMKVGKGNNSRRSLRWKSRRQARAVTSAKKALGLPQSILESQAKEKTKADIADIGKNIYNIEQSIIKQDADFQVKLEELSKKNLQGEAYSKELAALTAENEKGIVEKQTELEGKKATFETLQKNLSDIKSANKTKKTQNKALEFIPGKTSPEGQLKEKAEENKKYQISKEILQIHQSRIKQEEEFQVKLEELSKKNLQGEEYSKELAALKAENEKGRLEKQTELEANKAKLESVERDLAFIRSENQTKKTQNKALKFVPGKTSPEGQVVEGTHTAKVVRTNSPAGGPKKELFTPEYIDKKVAEMTAMSRAASAEEEKTRLQEKQKIETAEKAKQEEYLKLVTGPIPTEIKDLEALSSEDRMRLIVSSVKLNPQLYLNLPPEQQTKLNENKEALVKTEVEKRVAQEISELPKEKEAALTEDNKATALLYKLHETQVASNLKPYSPQMSVIENNPSVIIKAGEVVTPEVIKEKSSNTILTTTPIINTVPKELKVNTTLKPTPTSTSTNVSVISEKRNISNPSIIGKNGPEGIKAANVVTTTENVIKPTALVSNTRPNVVQKEVNPLASELKEVNQKLTQPTNIVIKTEEVTKPTALVNKANQSKESNRLNLVQKEVKNLASESQTVEQNKNKEQKVDTPTPTTTPVKSTPSPTPTPTKATPAVVTTLSKKEALVEAARQKKEEEQELSNIIGKVPGLTPKQQKAKTEEIKAQHAKLVKSGLPITLKELAEAETKSTETFFEERIKSMEGKSKQELNSNNQPKPIKLTDHELYYEKQTMINSINELDIPKDEAMTIKRGLITKYNESLKNGYRLDIRELTDLYSDKNTTPVQSLILNAKAKKQEEINLKNKTPEELKEIEAAINILKESTEFKPGSHHLILGNLLEQKQVSKKKGDLDLDLVKLAQFKAMGWRGSQKEDNYFKEVAETKAAEIEAAKAAQKLSRKNSKSSSTPATTLKNVGSAPPLVSQATPAAG